MTKTTAGLVLGLATLAVVAFAIWLFRPQPPPPSAELNCPQLAPLASSSSAAVSEQTQKLDAALGKSLTGSGSADFANQVQQQLQQAYQAIPQPLVACQLITQASLCAIGKDPALGMRFYGDVAASLSEHLNSVKRCPLKWWPASTRRRSRMPGTPSAPPSGSASSSPAPVSAPPPPPPATPPASAAPANSALAHPLPARAVGGGVMLRPGIEAPRATINPGLLTQMAAPPIEDCMDHELKPSAGVCTGPRTPASTSLTASELERQSTACAKSKSNLFYGDTQTDAAVLYWHVCSFGKRQPYDCKCVGHKT